MFCTECGKPVKNDYKFCPHCGAPRDKDLMEHPEEEPSSRASETRTAEEPSAGHADTEENSYAEDAPAQNSAAEEPAEQESPNWSASRFEESEEDDLDPPLSFSYEEEPPRRPAQHAPYFVYHPDSDNHQVRTTDSRENPDRPSLCAEEPAKRSPLAVSPSVSRGPSWGIKVLVILVIIALALTASIFGYQYLFTSKPFEPGWFFGLHFV